MVEVGEDQREEGQTLIYVILPSPRLTDQLLLDIFLMSRGEFQMRVFFSLLHKSLIFSLLSRKICWWERKLPSNSPFFLAVDNYYFREENWRPKEEYSTDP